MALVEIPTSAQHGLVSCNKEASLWILVRQGITWVKMKLTICYIYRPTFVSEVVQGGNTWIFYCPEKSHFFRIPGSISAFLVSIPLLCQEISIFFPFTSANTSLPKLVFDAGLCINWIWELQWSTSCNCITGWNWAPHTDYPCWLGI